MQIDYYPGCTIKASAQQHEASALAALHALSVQPREMDSWNCCGVEHSLASDNLIQHVAPVRVFTQLQQQRSNEVVTFCDMCYNTLAQTNVLVQHAPAKGAAINEFIDADSHYDGAATVLHLLQILRDRVGWKAVRKRVKRPLKELTVFPYYGCKLLRPGAVGIDNAEEPAVLRDLMEALGARVVDDPMQTQCCGSYHVVNRDEVVRERKETGVVIVEPDLVLDHAIDRQIYPVHATAIAQELGNKTNIVMLGALTAIARPVSRQAITESTLESVPSRFVDLNREALEAGFRAGETALAQVMNAG